jgi:hypothetical protein
LKNRIEETKSFCEITGAHTVLIREKEKDQKMGIPCVCADELSLMRSPEDLSQEFKQASSVSHLQNSSPFSQASKIS